MQVYLQEPETPDTGVEENAEVKAEDGSRPPAKHRCL